MLRMQRARVCNDHDKQPGLRPPYMPAHIWRHIWHIRRMRTMLSRMYRAGGARLEPVEMLRFRGILAQNCLFDALVHGERRPHRSAELMHTCAAMEAVAELDLDAFRPFPRPPAYSYAVYAIYGVYGVYGAYVADVCRMYAILLLSPLPPPSLCERRTTGAEHRRNFGTGL